MLENTQIQIIYFLNCVQYKFNKLILRPYSHVSFYFLNSFDTKCIFWSRLFSKYIYISLNTFYEPFWIYWNLFSFIKNLYKYFYKYVWFVFHELNWDIIWFWNQQLFSFLLNLFLFFVGSFLLCSSYFLFWMMLMFPLLMLLSCLPNISTSSQFPAQNLFSIFDTILFVSVLSLVYDF